MDYIEKDQLVQKFPKLISQMMQKSCIKSLKEQSDKLEKSYENRYVIKPNMHTK